jgi:hypothetical protein
MSTSFAIFRPASSARDTTKIISSGLSARVRQKQLRFFKEAQIQNHHLVGIALQKTFCPLFLDGRLNIDIRICERPRRGLGKHFVSFKQAMSVFYKTPPQSVRDRTID